MCRELFGSFQDDRRMTDRMTFQLFILILFCSCTSPVFVKMKKNWGKRQIFMANCRVFQECLVSFSTSMGCEENKQTKQNKK